MRVDGEMDSAVHLLVGSSVPEGLSVGEWTLGFYFYICDWHSDSSIGLGFGMLLPRGIPTHDKS